jgi:hypothetical protein
MTLCMKRTKMRKYGHIFYIFFCILWDYFCLCWHVLFVSASIIEYLTFLWVRLPYHVCFFLVKIIRSYFYYVNAHGKWVTLLMMMKMMTKLGSMMTSTFVGHADLGWIQIWPPGAVARRPAWQMITQGCRIIHTNTFSEASLLYCPLRTVNF